MAAHTHVAQSNLANVQRRPNVEEAAARLVKVRHSIGWAWEAGRQPELDLLQTWHDLRVLLNAAGFDHGDLRPTVTGRSDSGSA